MSVLGESFAYGSKVLTPKESFRASTIKPALPTYIQDSNIKSFYLFSLLHIPNIGMVIIVFVVCHHAPWLNRVEYKKI